MSICLDLKRIAEVRFAAARAVARARTGEDQTDADLAALIGAGPDPGLAIERPILPENKAFSLPENLPAELLGRRPDVVVAGIVLAGGRSPRMGANKALLSYHGQPLYLHMQGILRASGLEQVYISGDVPEVECVPDFHPHDGPARPIADLMEKFSGVHARLLIVPVDIPLLTAEVLQTLLKQPGSSHLQGYPFPLCLNVGPIDAAVTSMYGLIEACRVNVLPCSVEHEKLMYNTNTPEEWQILQA